MVVSRVVYDGGKTGEKPHIFWLFSLRSKILWSAVTGPRLQRKKLLPLFPKNVDFGCGFNHNSVFLVCGHFLIIFFEDQTAKKFEP